jgi:hypothetical protein
VPIPGDKATDVEFTFKARTRDQFKDFIEKLKDREDVDVVMDIACGWELDDAWSAENVEKLTQIYIGASKAIIEKYITELTNARLGNS